MAGSIHGASGAGKRGAVEDLAQLDHGATKASPDCDVLVIGGGPAGATTAALLAERGHRVILVEKERHPRFHIGESLLPMNLPLFDRLGIRAEVERGSMTKQGIEFVSSYHGKTVTYNFAGALDKRFPYSFQVRRSTFDEILFRNAAAKGATTIENCRITSVEFPEDGFARIEGRDETGEMRHWTAAFVVDASGRDTLLASQLGVKERNPRNNSAAMYAHFSGARRLPGKAEGNISVVWFDHGWFWFIPLSDGTTSVGAVAPAAFFKNRGTDIGSFFKSVVASCPEIASRLKDAEMIGEVTATGNYSYGATVASGGKFIMVGDAWAFVDPVFSTGVFLAMTMGFHGAEAVDTCLRKPAKARRALKTYEAATRQSLSSISWFIYRIREPAMRNLFMSPRNWFRMEEAVLSLLAGDVFGGWKIRSRLYLFRAIFYVTKFSHLRHRLKAPAKLNADPAIEVAG
jgi:flavin-dependent dehydrogenase